MSIPVERTPNGARKTNPREVVAFAIDRNSRDSSSKAYLPRFKHRPSDTVRMASAISTLKPDAAEQLSGYLRYALRNVDTTGIRFFGDASAPVAPHLIYAFRNPGANRDEDEAILGEVAANCGGLAALGQKVSALKLEANGFIVMPNQIVVSFTADSWNQALDVKALIREEVPVLKDGAYSLDHSPISTEPYGETVQVTVAVLEDGRDLAPWRQALSHYAPRLSKPQFSVAVELDGIEVVEHAHQAESVIETERVLARVDLQPALEQDVAAARSAQPSGAGSLSGLF